MTDITPSAFASMQSDLAHVKVTLDQLAQDVRPLLLARSGDLAAVAGMQRDLDAVHAKSRAAESRFAEIDARVDAVERRFDQAKWMVISAFGLIQLVWGVFGRAILRGLGLGG